MEPNQRVRIVEFDMLRVVAICLVLICHSCEQAFPPNGGSVPMAILHSIGRTGVPYFLFLTGALILRKEFVNNRSVLAFYRNSLVPLLVTVEIWIALYGLFLMLTGQTFTFIDYIKCAFFINNIPMMHWWYIPTILIIYIALPFTSRAIAHLDVKDLRLPFALIIILGFLAPTANGLLSLIGKSAQSTLDITPLGGFYLFYVVLGLYLLTERSLASLPNSQLITILLIGILGSCLQEFLGLGLWYNSLFIALLAISSSEFILRILSMPFLKERVHRTGEKFALLSKTAFFVYFVHVPVLTFIEKQLSSLSSALLHFSLSFLGTLLFSYLIALTAYYLLRNAPRIRKAIFNS